jgi:hypothetical protein
MPHIQIKSVACENKLKSFDDDDDDDDDDVGSISIFRRTGYKKKPSKLVTLKPWISKVKLSLCLTN